MNTCIRDKPKNNMSIRVLLFGASGLLGSELVDYLLGEDDFEVHAIRGRKDMDVIHASDQDLDALFKRSKPVACINCIAQRSIEACQDDWDSICQVNIDVADKLARACANNGVYLVHISTDYVFDGTSAPYIPSDVPNPLQNYGISKCIAEFRVMKYVRKHQLQSAIVRVPVLYSDKVARLSDSAVTEIGRALMNQVKPCVVDDVYTRRPVFIRDMCKYLAHLVRHPEYGIRHMYNPYDALSKYSILKMIAGILEKPYTHIQVTKKGSALRPYDTQLYDAQSDEFMHQNTTRLEDGLIACFTPFYHPPLCSAYSRSMFLLLDLDGTLVDSDRLHVQCYCDAIHAEHGIHVPEETLMTALQNNAIDTVLQDMGLDVARVKTTKQALFTRREAPQLMPGADKLIAFIADHHVNHVVVTNTSREIVDYLRSKIPVLNKLSNWVTRQDYEHKKPAPDCYEKAVALYYQGEPYTIGFENTYAGYSALRSITKRIYMIGLTASYELYDAYIVDSLAMALPHDDNNNS